jgi:glc operon protein GlcG
LCGLAAWLILFAPLPATAQEKSGAKPRSDVRDGAHFWSDDVIKTVRENLIGIERAYGIPTLIQSVDSLHGEPLSAAVRRLRKEIGGADAIHIPIERPDPRLPDEQRMDISFPASVDLNAASVYGREITNAYYQAVQVQASLRGGTVGMSGLPPAVAKCSPDDIALLTLVRLLESRVAPNLASRLAESARAKNAPAGGEPARKAEKVASEPKPATPGTTKQSGEDAALVLRNQVRLTLGGARTILAAAEAKAAEMKLKVNIAVVDDGGHMISFIRMDGARPASGYTATTKAVTAATFRQATGPLPAGAATPDLLLNLSLQNAATASGGKITTLYGGVPVVVEGQVIGGVGVGGGTGEQDATIARAGIDALLKQLGAAAPTQK